MKLIFWQNIVSPHQVDLLQELAKIHDVTLIVEKKIDSYRSKQSWSTNVPENINLLINPSLSDVVSIVKKTDNATHIFSGFLAYKLVTFAFFLTIFLKKRIFIISEAIEYKTAFGKLKLRFRRCFSMLLRNNILGVFSTGLRSKNYFLKLGFRNNRIYDFGYFVNIKSQKKITPKRKYTKLIFVGRLTQDKGLRLLLDAFEKLTFLDSFYQLEIIGSGSLKQELKQLVDTNDNICSKVIFTEDLKRPNVLDKIEGADLLLLPNTGEEGWGVVINEALLLGTPVICTKFTGANVIVESCSQGIVLSNPKPIALAEAIVKMKNYDRQDIINKSNERIKPEIVSKYFTDVLANKSGSFTPWVKN